MRFVANTGDQVLAFPLRPGSTIIGRHATCHICLPSKSVSRRHAQVYIDGASVVLRDLGSSHGTYVNGQRVERADLRDGDVVSIGGVQMRFEGGVPAAAYPHAAPAAQDIVVTAEPASPGGAAPTEPLPPYGEPVGPAPTYPQEGAPAPTDAPESPRGDETPVDQAFVPGTYAAPQPSMLPSATLQPQMVIRDGRWYLRDPRTGREVEIAPKDTALAPATAIPAEARRPNVRLLLAAVGAAVFIVLTFALFVFSPRQPDDDMVKRDDRVKKTKLYNDMVDKGIDLFNKKKADDALAILEDASKMRPDIGTAGHISLYIRLRKTAGDDLDKFSWSEASRYLDSVLNSPSVSEPARAFVSAQTGWMKTERHALGILDDIVSRLREGQDVPEDVLKAAYNDLISQIPPGTFAWRKAQGLRATLKVKLYELYSGRAKRNEAEKKWPEAVTQWNEALNYTDTPASIKKQIADDERFARDALALAQVSKEFEENKYEAADAHAKAIIPPSPYLDDAKGYISRIAAAKGEKDRKDKVEKISNLYRDGSGREAAKLAKEWGLPEFSYIGQRVDQWEKIMGEADAAEKAKEYETERDKLQEAVGVEPDAKNWYHAQAENRLQTLKARSHEIADEFARRASKEAEANPLKARADAERAKRWEADNALAKAVLDGLQHTATISYPVGMALIDKGQQYVEAERVLRHALDCADPISLVHKRIREALEKIPR